MRAVPLQPGLPTPACPPHSSSPPPSDVLDIQLPDSPGPVSLSRAARPATPSLARPRAGYADSVPAELRAAARAGDWTRVATLATAHPGHSCLRLPVASGGHTALHLAATAGAADATRALLTAGSQADAADARGATALHLAAAGGHATTIRALLDGGATIVRDAAGKTPLHAAAWAGRTAALAELLPAASAAGALDAVGADGRAALHCAGLSTDAALADALLEAGASADLVDAQGRTPLDWAETLARASGERVVAARMRAAGARSATEIQRSGRPPTSPRRGRPSTHGV